MEDAREALSARPSVGHCSAPSGGYPQEWGALGSWLGFPH